jgi:hypothetical protein
MSKLFAATIWAMIGLTAFVSVLACSFLIATWFSYRNIFYVRYRLTIQVQDGDLLKTGATVIEAEYKLRPNVPFIYSGVSILGVAPSVDLGADGTVFLTFLDQTRTTAQWEERKTRLSCSFGDVGCLPFAAYQISGGSEDFDQVRAAFHELLRQKGPRDVPLAALPTLVRFADLNEEPTKPTVVYGDDLDTHSKQGVTLRRAVLELTDDPISTRPKNWPQWLRRWHPVAGFAEPSADWAARVQHRLDALFWDIY